MGHLGTPATTSPAASSSGHPLAVTGFNSRYLLWVALGLILVGLLLAAPRRRGATAPVESEE